MADEQATPEMETEETHAEATVEAVESTEDEGSGGSEQEEQDQGGPDGEAGPAEDEDPRPAADEEQEGDVAEEAVLEATPPPRTPARGAAASAVSIENDPLLDEWAAYEPSTLVRALQPWEISRDHLVFGDMCGLDQGKRHFVHVLEPPEPGSHGGVVLTAAGNTVQLLMLAWAPDAAQIRALEKPVQSRKYLFGSSGSGIGALAVHPSRRFFAVAEKGIKPNICIYQYPSARVCRVLRNGTESAFSSVVFSQDGETLASVGCAPDYLLTVWQWRQEQTILRSKAFGQDVFSVRFAPNDAGFLTTSGVGHIRFWKMASTFTGLKLQGDIGKFGKSELSDIEAFCVLPDKKVLSGTERGVLLLWDGNFIKCEIMTSRRHLPHNGRIHVVQFEPESHQIVTAGSDGCVKFWSFDAIDKADLRPEDVVALVPFKRSVLIQPQLDIRAVVRCSETRYLIQSADGAIHLLMLAESGSTGAGGSLDGGYDVVMDFVANPTGRAAGVVCSPYEHLAVSCGHDGSVRAWDYVTRTCLFAASTTVFTKNEGDGSPIPWTASATAISWVPTVSALVSGDSPLSRSRQVVVGFSDGLVRVLLLDLARQSFVRTNVFKPHSARVTTLQFSPSGVFLATASADSTFFLFKIVPSQKTSKFAKFPPDYVPLGFQKCPAEIRSLVWRDDDQAVLLTLTNGSVVEYTVPMDGSLETLAEMRNSSESSDGMPTGEPEAEAGAAKASETYELNLESRMFTTLLRRRPLSTKELEALEGLSGSPQADEVIRNDFHSSDGSTTALQAWAACYYSKDTILVSIRNPSTSAPQSTTTSLVLCQWGKASPLKELASESAGAVVTLALSLSRKYVLCGLASGKFQVRTHAQPLAFLTGEFHDGTHYSDASTSVALSFDDSFLVTCGADGNLSLGRLHMEKMDLAARLMDEKCEKLLAEATIVGEQALEKQKAQLDVLQKAAAEEAKQNGDDSGSSSAASGSGASNDLAMLPTFQRAKAFAAYMESQLEGATAENNVAKDEEIFQGVVRLVSDTNSTLGLPLAATLTPADEAGGAVLSALEVPDIANPNEAYTIEDAKRKSEADARAMSTRSKQDRTRDILEKMRQQLQELKSLDASYAPESRLDEDEWEIDLEYGDLLVKRGDNACEEVKKELAFAVEREELLLLKMRETYVSPLAVELLTLRAFESGLSVQSFRTLKMPPLLQKRLNEIHMTDSTMAKPKAHSTSQVLVVGSAEASAKVGVPRRPSVLHIMAKDADLDEAFPLKEDERKLLQRGALGASGSQSMPPGAPHAGASGGGHHDATATGAAPAVAVHGFEARKRLRADRKARLIEWMGNKPGEDADDPRDLVAIAFAQRNMGDYKLKTAPNYVVPEAQRVNTAKKRRQMALLEERIYEAKLSFNAKVLELRELKLLLIQEMKSDQSRMLQLQQKLTSAAAAVVAANDINKTLEVDLSEWPEQRERVSDADIELFLKEKLVRPHAVITKQASGSVASEAVANGAAGRRRSSVSIAIDGKLVETDDRTIAAVSRRLGGSNNENHATNNAENTAALRVRHLAVNEAGGEDVALETTEKDGRKTRGVDPDERAIRVYLMQQELLRLQRKQRDEIRAFDDAIAHLRREKMRLDVVFKKCELKLFTLLSELVLLEQFESRENLLSTKLEKSKNEKAQIVAEINDIQESMGNKRKEVEEWSKQEKAIQAEFLVLVNGGSGSSGSTASQQHPSFTALQKIFKKKIKRAKKKAVTVGKDGKDGGDGGDGDPSHEGDGNREDEDDDEDDDEEDSDFDDNDDDDDDDEDDVCPAGCDLQLYEKVLALREKRADVDDAMSDLNKAMDELKKSNDRQVAKQRQIDKELQATEQDIQAFQSEKQMRFNQLDIVVALSKQQIRCLVPKASTTHSSGSIARGRWELPEQANSSLVFAVQSFDALADRIESLQKENKSLRQQFKDLHKQQNVLAKDKKVQQDKIAAIQHKCEQLQLLKFGQLVDIELLDKACDTTHVGELQAKVRAKEMDAERDLSRVKQSQQQLKRQILVATEQNTALLSRIAELNARQLELEKELNHANVGQSLLQDESEQMEREMRERNKLVKIVKLQAREVDALKQEIGLLRGKDGKVYAPRG